MSKHGNPPKWRSYLRKPSFRTPLAFSTLIALLLTTISAGLVVATPASATTSTNGDQCVYSYEWVRDVAPQVTEKQYKKSVEDTKTQYFFAKFTRTKTKSADVWQNFSPNKDQGKFEGPPAWPSDPRGTWQHINKPIPPGQQGPDGVYQNGKGNGSWFYRAAGTWSDYGPWTKWSPETHTSWQDSTDPLGSPAFHAEGTNKDGSQWYRQWQARYVEGKTRQVPNGSHWVYYVKGSAPSTNKDDASWVTSSPGGDWTEFDTRTVDGESQHQGPVRSVDEPDRGGDPNVPWTKVAGSEEQESCTVNNEVTDLVVTAPCVKQGETTPASFDGKVNAPAGDTTLVLYPKGVNQQDIANTSVTTDGTNPVGFTINGGAFGVGNYAAGDYVIHLLNSDIEGFLSFDVPAFEVKACDTPPPPCVETIGEGDVKAYYTKDDFTAEVKYTGKPLCDGVSKTVSLNSYGTDGPTWETSGDQKFVDHDQVTLDKNTVSGTLTVKAPKCFYQTDLYFGSKKFDGVDGALPHYPDSVTPTNLIAARNGGVKCDVPPPPVEFTTSFGTQKCVAGLGPNGTFNDEVVGEPASNPVEAASPVSSINGNVLTQSLTPNDGYVPAEGQKLEQAYTDDGSDCGQQPPPPVDKPVVTVKYTGVTCKVDVATATLKVGGKTPVYAALLSDRSPYVEDYSEGEVKPGQEVTLKSEPLALGEKVNFQAAWAAVGVEDDSFESVDFTVERPKNCDTKPPTTPVKHGPKVQTDGSENGLNPLLPIGGLIAGLMLVGFGVTRRRSTIG